mmetsp:Transcript_39838/g.95067  ORF Transcript_39838/g.95067 Transcript_39838/m.95067 type:complete len:371 (+) Transcript_39838:346-1458(+)
MVATVNMAQGFITAVRQDPGHLRGQLIWRPVDHPLSEGRKVGSLHLGGVLLEPPLHPELVPVHAGELAFWSRRRQRRIVHAVQDVSHGDLPLDAHLWVDLVSDRHLVHPAEGNNLMPSARGQIQVTGHRRHQRGIVQYLQKYVLGLAPDLVEVKDRAAVQIALNENHGILLPEVPGGGHDEHFPQDPRILDLCIHELLRVINLVAHQNALQPLHWEVRAEETHPQPILPHEAGAQKGLLRVDGKSIEELVVPVLLLEDAPSKTKHCLHIPHIVLHDLLPAPGEGIPRRGRVLPQGVSMRQSIDSRLGHRVLPQPQLLLHKASHLEARLGERDERRVYGGAICKRLGEELAQHAHKRIQGSHVGHIKVEEA